MIPQVIFLRVGPAQNNANLNGTSLQGHLFNNATSGPAATLPSGVSTYPPGTLVLGSGQAPYTVALP